MWLTRSLYTMLGLSVFNRSREATIYMSSLPRAALGLPHLPSVFSGLQDLLSVSLSPSLSFHRTLHTASVQSAQMESRRVTWKMVQIHLGERCPSLSVPHWDNPRNWRVRSLCSVRDICFGLYRIGTIRASGLVSFPVWVRGIHAGLYLYPAPTRKSLVLVSRFEEAIFE